MYTEFSVAAASFSSLSFLFFVLLLDSPYILVKLSLPSYDRIPSIRPICATRIIDLPNIASDPSTKCDIYIYTLARLRFVYFVCRNFNLSRHHKKRRNCPRSSMQVEGKERFVGGAYACGVYAFVDTYARARKILTAEKEREIKRPSKKEEVLLACT